VNAQWFNQVLADQIDRINEILGSKAGEYADDADRLHNFKASASLQGITPIEALRGKMAKHTISIYDMIASKKAYPVEKWDEKITDHINYLILLRALVVEEDEEDAKLGTGSTD
jgi:hypothetical protein